VFGPDEELQRFPAHQPIHGLRSRLHAPAPRQPQDHHACQRREPRKDGMREWQQGLHSRQASIANRVLVPVQSPNAMATIASPGPGDAPSSTAVTAAQRAPRATAISARSHTCDRSDEPRPSRDAAIQEPKSDAPASQRYRRSEPVLTARMSPNSTGITARSAEPTSNNRRRCVSDRSITDPTIRKLPDSEAGLKACATNKEYGGDAMAPPPSRLGIRDPRFEIKDSESAMREERLLAHEEHRAGAFRTDRLWSLFSVFVTES
jgi:hypothetical protein